MPDAVVVVEFLGGLVYLLLAGDLLIRGSLALAKRAHVSPLLVGLTIVAFGTSAPELVVAVHASFSGHPGIAIGNVVGSNIANVLLVMGLPAIIHPTACDQHGIGCHALVLVLVSVGFALACWSGPLGWLQGLVMLAVLALLITRTAFGGGGMGLDAAEAEEELNRVLGLPRTRTRIAVFIGLGAVGLPLGAELMVDASVKMAAAAGVSDEVIGLSIIAIGTSLPELGTTVVAALHRSADVAVGNIVGSNLLNILAIMGITAVLAPASISVPASFARFDLWVMLAATLVLAGFCWTRSSIGRGSGTALLVAYGAYLVTLFTI